MLKGKGRGPRQGLGLGLLCVFSLFSHPLSGQVTDSPAQRPDNYTPPAVPKLYEKGESEALNQIGLGPRSHPFVGGGLSLGQSRSTGASSPIAALGANVELGYVKVLGSWSRVESSMAFTTAKVGHSQADMWIKGGLMARLGYGYSLGNQLFGLISAGVGALFAAYEDESSGFKRRTPGLMLGTAVEASYQVEMPMSPTLAWRAGLSWTHMSFHLDELSVGDNRIKVSQPIGLNVPAVTLGLRLKLQG